MLNLTESFAPIRKWVRRQKLRSQHHVTLAQYSLGVFDYLGATIGIGDALEEGILDPECLGGDKLLSLAPSLDERVWNAWHDISNVRVKTCKYRHGMAWRWNRWKRSGPGCTWH